MSSGEPTFAEIAAALAEEVAYLAGPAALIDPLAATLPDPAPGVEWALAAFRRHLVLMVAAQRLLAAMAPREGEHRALLPSGAAKGATAQHVVSGR